MATGLGAWDETFAFICVAFTFAAIVALPAAAPDPVRTDAGLIAPAANSPDGVRVFRGIPFGAPPVGPLRWKAPQPVAHWDGVRKADAFGPVCVQPKGAGRLNVSVDMPDSPRPTKTASISTCGRAPRARANGGR